MPVKRSRDDEEYGPYQAYMIRLWPTKREGVSDCWISLQDVATGNRQEFPNLKQFFSFIQTQKDQSVSLHSADPEPKPSS